ncbi:hypothetical protein MUP79_08530 [Candidatus Bathyarchaeota archaeon]|nr:hypothetical protein [Candidatus Bathyarchaeota archaeon]
MQSAFKPLRGAKGSALKERVRETIISLRELGFAVFLYTEGDVNKIGSNRSLLDDCMTIPRPLKE